MLILTRRPGESVKIGDDITVTVLGVRGNQLRLGFSAPQNVAVHREEVYERIQSGRRPANGSHVISGSFAGAGIHRYLRVPGGAGESPLGLLNLALRARRGEGD